MLYRQLFAAAALLGSATAQVFTDCNPTEKDCPPNPALGTTETFHFNATPNGELWETVVGPIAYDDENGARFTIAKQGDSPTIRTNFYFFFGRVEFLMKAAHGRGIVSSMMLLSDDLDEIDWEFIGANTTHGSSNFFGKGEEIYTNGAWHGMEVAPQDEFHNYTTVWTKDKLEFYLNDALVRTVTHEESKDAKGKDIYPQTPMRMSLGIWAGGDPSLNEWTRKWAGGDTDFNAGPYDMFVKQVHIEDFSSGKEYAWGDRSGSWESINVVEGNSTAVKVINQEPEKSLNEKFNGLPQAGKIAIYAGGAAVAAVILGAIIFYCIRQRRRGASEARMALQRNEADRLELDNVRSADADPFAETKTSYTSNYQNLPVTSPGLEREKGWDQAAAFAGAGTVGAGAGYAASRSPPANGNPAQGGYFEGRGPMSQASQMRNPSAPSAYARVGSPGPQAYGANRMQTQSPGGPSPMSPGRSVSDNYGFNQSEGYRDS